MFVRFSVLLATVLAASPASARRADAALVQLAGDDVPGDLAGTMAQRVKLSLEGPGNPELIPAEEAEGVLLGTGSADALTDQASDLLAAARELYLAGAEPSEIRFELAEARRLLLRSLPRKPMLERLQEAWAMTGLLAHASGDTAGAREAFERVLESDPSYRPDPRLFPPEARQLMGEVFLGRTDSQPRVLAAADAAELGGHFLVHHLVLAHLRDAGGGQYVYMLDVFDLSEKRWVAHAEVAFEDTPTDQTRAADTLAEFVAANVPATEALGAAVSVVEVEDRRRPAPEPVTETPPPAAPSSNGAWYGQWWVWAVVAGVVAAGSAGVVAAQPEGRADLLVRRH